MPVVDRSRFSTSWGRCQRLRFLQYHSGNGFGIHRKAQALPLATGIQVHKILEGLFKLGVAGSPEEVRVKQRKVIVDAVEGYKAEALASGILQLAQETNSEGGDAAQRQVIEEQAALIEGLGWAAVRVFVPKVLQEYEVVSVEQEEEYVLECDCGLGEGVGTGDEHQAKECGGIVLMSRPDLILRHKVSRQLIYVEFKTSGDVGNYNWREQFEDNVQLALGVVGAEKRLGEEIPSCMVVGFNKGWRKKGYDKENKGYTGAKKQDSFFCYVYRKEANPPHWEEEIATSYTYVDQDGKNRQRTETKGWEKVPVWECEFAAKPMEWTKMEYFVHWIEEEEVQSQVQFVGPLPTPRYLVKDLLEALGAEEKRWTERLFAVWEAQGKGEAEFAKALNVYVPQTWECYRWGKKCQMLGVCRKDEDPYGEDGKLKEGWQNRRPHHDREIRLMEQLGIEVPKEFGEEEGGVE